MLYEYYTNLRREKRKPGAQESRGEERKGKEREGQEEGGWRRTALHQPAAKHAPSGWHQELAPWLPQAMVKMVKVKTGKRPKKSEEMGENNDRQRPQGRTGFPAMMCNVLSCFIMFSSPSYVGPWDAAAWAWTRKKPKPRVPTLVSVTKGFNTKVLESLFLCVCVCVNPGATWLSLCLTFCRTL